MTPPRVVVVLPARYDSTRFPGKPLVRLAGKPLIEWVYRRAQQIEAVSRIVVATDHDDIASVVRAFGGEVIMTSPTHATGTDRVAEVAQSLSEEIIVNLQGDEPLFPPSLIRDMVAVLANDSAVDIVTACHALDDPDDICNPNIVKVVMDRRGRALYFSRSPIPAQSHGGQEVGEPRIMYRHVGIYVFRREKLLQFAAAQRTPLERAECLEQLRALEHGMVLQVVKTRYATVGIDVPEDVKNVEKALTAF